MNKSGFWFLGLGLILTGGFNLLEINLHNSANASEGVWEIGKCDNSAFDCLKCKKPSNCQITGGNDPGGHPRCQRNGEFEGGYSGCEFGPEVNMGACDDDPTEGDCYTFSNTDDHNACGDAQNPICDPEENGNGELEDCTPTCQKTEHITDAHNASCSGCQPGNADGDPPGPGGGGGGGQQGAPGT